MSRSWHKRRDNYNDESSVKFSDRRRKKQNKQLVHNNIGGTEEENADLYDREQEDQAAQ